MAPRQSLVHLTWRARRAAHGLSRHLPSLGAVSRVEDSLLGVGDESSSGADRGAPFGRAVSAMRSAKHRLARVWWRSELPIKGSLLAAYHGREDKIKQFLKTSRIKFNSPPDISKLVDFLNKLD